MKKIINNAIDYKGKATLVGSIALVMWSISAVINTELLNIPIFEILSIMLTIGFLAACVLLTVSGRWAKLKTAPLVWLCAIVGIYGNDILYITAFKHAPAVHVELITYLWPILVICLAHLLPREHFRWRHIYGAMLGMLAMYVLLYQESAGFQWDYLPGYLAAFSAALVWTAYILMTRYLGEIPVELISMVCGVGAVLSWLIHTSTEIFIPPSAYQLGLIAIMGLTAHLIAYFSWQYGLNYGNYRLLSVLSYFTAVLSVILLIICGKAQPTLELGLACALVVLGAIICGMGEKKAIKSGFRS